MRAANKVIAALCRWRQEFVYFPEGEQARKAKEDFYQIAHFPGVVSAIDCTHIRIVKPSVGNPEIYRSRKKQFFYSRPSGL